MLVSCSVPVSSRVLRLFDLSNHLGNGGRRLGFVKMEWKKMDDGMKWLPRESSLTLGFWGRVYKGKVGQIGKGIV
jgi:hypothetical protein